MQTTPHIFLSIFLTFLLFFTIIPTAEAAFSGSPRPPDAAVIQVDSLQFTSPPGVFQSNFSLAFHLSPDDPDQVNGSFIYKYYFNNTAYATGWQPINLSGFSSCTQHSIPGMIGWVSVVAGCGLSITGPGTNDSHSLIVNITANNSGFESPPSCLLNISDIRYTVNTTRASHDQCGYPQIHAPPAITAFVHQTSSANASGSIDVNWLLSTEDPNNNTALFNYRVFGTTSSASGGYNVTSSASDRGIDPIGVNDTNGIRYFQEITSGTSPYTAGFLIRAEEQVTHQWSNLSCAAQVHTDHLSESNSCGAFVTGDSPVANVIGPQFPFVNVTEKAQQLNISVTNLGWILAAALIFGSVGLGFATAKGIGAGLGGTFSVAACFVLGLFPWWLAIMLFTVALGFIIANFTNRGASE